MRAERVFVSARNDIAQKPSPDHALLLPLCLLPLRLLRFLRLLLSVPHAAFASLAFSSAYALANIWRP